MITVVYVLMTSYIYSIDFYICRRQLTHIIMSLSIHTDIPISSGLTEIRSPLFRQGLLSNHRNLSLHNWLPFKFLHHHLDNFPNILSPRLNGPIYNL